MFRFPRNFINNWLVVVNCIIILKFIIVRNCCLHVGQRHGDLRLVGPNEYEGRVEVYFSAETGFIPICYSLLFYFQEADVICRQLTFVGAETFGTVSKLGLV